MLLPIFHLPISCVLLLSYSPHSLLLLPIFFPPLLFTSLTTLQFSPLSLILLFPSLLTSSFLFPPSPSSPSHFSSILLSPFFFSTSPSPILSSFLSIIYFSSFISLNSDVWFKILLSYCVLAINCQFPSIFLSCLQNSGFFYTYWKPRDPGS